MNNIKNSNRDNIQSTLLSDVRLDTEIASTHFCKLKGTTNSRVQFQKCPLTDCFMFLKHVCSELQADLWNMNHEQEPSLKQKRTIMCECVSVYYVLVDFNSDPIN